MAAEISDIVKESLEVESGRFIEVIEEVSRMLAAEDGKVGRLHVTGRLVEVESPSDTLVVGDIHGDLESLIHILKESHITRELERNEAAMMVFLGDYGDRGAYSAEVYYTVAKLKLLYPRQVVLLRGNHEGPEDLIASPHDLPLQLKAKFGQDWTQVYARLRELFGCLYNALLVRNRCLMVHGGLPVSADIESLAYAHKLHPQQRILEDLLWSDPDETIEGTSPSPRGAGRLFGKDVTNEALTRIGARILIRGHEPCEKGYKICHDGKILTLFSRKGPPYFNTCGAYLLADLSQRITDAWQLLSSVQEF